MLVRIWRDEPIAYRNLEGESIMIINNVNGTGGFNWTQSGKDDPTQLTGQLKAGEYTSFTPNGKKPFTVNIDTSNGFTVNGIESPDEMITYYNVGSPTQALLTQKTG
jgi:hypothetical protein